MIDHKKDWEVYYKLMLANGTSSLYKTARDLHILDFNNGHPFSAIDLASGLSYQLGPLIVFLDNLSAIGILNKEKDLYSVSRDMEKLQGIYQNLGDEYWTHLPELIKNGTPYKKEGSNPIQDYQNQMLSLGWMMESSAIEMCSILKFKDSEKISVLDIGSGSGVWSYEILRNHKLATTHLLDFPFLLPLAEKKLSGMNERVKMTAGNISEMNFPSSKFDLIVMGNVSHLQTPDGNQKIFKKAFDALSDTGSFVILDTFGLDPRGREARASYQMGFTLKTVVGTVYPSDLLKCWLAEKGFKHFEFHSLDVSPHTIGMLIARK